MTAAPLRDEIGGRQDLGDSVGRGKRQSGGFKHRQVRHIVSDRRGLRAFHIQRLEQRCNGRAFVAAALDHMGDAKFRATACDGAALPAGDDRDLDTGVDQAAQSIAVLRMKRLAFVAGFVEREAPVGHDTVDIEDDQL